MRCVRKSKTRDLFNPLYGNKKATYKLASQFFVYKHLLEIITITLLDIIRFKEANKNKKYAKMHFTNCGIQ